MAVRLAFSAGVESLYLAQMFLDKGKEVELHYGNIRGVFAEPQEAGMVYRCYLKLKELYGDKVSLFYCTQKYFTTAQTNKLDSAHGVNQAFRVACMLTDIMAYSGNHIYVCGWTGSGAMENSLSPGCYTEQDYEDMKNLPRTLQRFTRAFSFPNTILTPLKDQSKKEIYNKIRPELLDYLVLNGEGEYIAQSKLDEYKEEGLELPRYLDGVIKPSVPAELWKNDFARFFYTPGQWFGECSVGDSDIMGVLDTMRPFDPRYQARMPADDVLMAVRIFRRSFEKIVSLMSATKEKDSNETA